MCKTKKSKVWKKIVSFVIIGAIVASAVFVDKSMQVKATEQNEYVYENEYASEDLDLESVVITCEDEENYRVEAFKVDGSKVETVYNGETVSMIMYDEFGCIREIETKDVLFDERDTSDLKQANRSDFIKWKKKRVEEYKNQYWYRKGTDKKDKDVDYLRIGLNDQYKQFTGAEIGEHQMSYVEKLDEFREKYTLVNMSMIALESGGVIAELIVTSGLALGASISSIKNIFGKWAETKPELPKNKEDIEKYIYDMVKITQLYTEVEQAYGLAMQ